MLSVDSSLRPFDLRQPTRVVFGSRAARQAGTCARWYGRRVLLVSGAGSARASGLLAEVEAALSDAGCRVEHFAGVGPNPGVDAVDAGAALAASRLCEVVVSVGGGSVLDCGKAIATAAFMNRPGTPDPLGSYRGLLSGLRIEGTIVTGSLPSLAIPTLPGSGSATNGTSVISDPRTHRKLSCHSDRSAPRVALIDPSWAADAPRRLLAAGFADALAHALEARLSARASVASDHLADAAAATLLADGPAALDLLATGGDAAAPLARCAWACELAGQALTLAGSIVTHPLSHPLSARLDAHHGEAVAALAPVVVELLGEAPGDDVELSVVARWFGSRARTTQGQVKAVAGGLRDAAAALGVEAPRLAGLDDALVERMVADVLASGSRGLANTPGGVPDAQWLAAAYRELASTA